MMIDKQHFNDLANLAQKSLDYFYKSDDEQQFLNNFYPLESEKDNETFNYWWIAHTTEVRIDAYERTKDQKFLTLAIETYAYNKKRNHGTLIHDYYDDMLWNALAGFRLYQCTNKMEYLEDAKLVWEDLVTTGWNDICGGGFAWRKPQMYYKNTPVNAPFIILSTWLYQELNEEKYLTWAIKTFDWLKKVLVRENSFVEDGINRENDGKIDTQWQFTYNQGVYIGGCLELFKITEESKFFEEAANNIKATFEILGDGKIIQDRTEGMGDDGLFKGIFYRYFTDFILLAKEETYRDFILEAVELLAGNAKIDNHLLMGMDWYKPQNGKIPFSAQLSGMIAIEMAAKLA